MGLLRGVLALPGCLVGTLQGSGWGSQVHPAPKLLMEITTLSYSPRERLGPTLTGMGNPGTCPPHPRQPPWA